MTLIFKTMQRIKILLIGKLRRDEIGPYLKELEQILLNVKLFFYQEDSITCFDFTKTLSEQIIIV